MTLSQDDGAGSNADSKLGGLPALPANVEWPTHKGRPLDFLLQVNLSDVSQHDSECRLPPTGLLSFFYDLENQPWGYDPADLVGFHVIFTQDSPFMETREVPDDEYELPERAVSFHSMLTLPHYGSRAADVMMAEVCLTDEEADSFFELPSRIEESFFEQEGSSNHHLLGHSANIQNNMQLEAQLVT